ncbi:MAG: hypothetical protein D6772_06860 [Bacteroidetes bacterium]|nr:MAG: hypothetical protein D6772_06860 [Bacteroidota bacterium]
MSRARGKELISFYVPTHRVAKYEENRIRYKNMLGQIKRELQQRGFDQPTIDRRLAQASAKVDEEIFWRHQSDCLAVFIDEEETHLYPLPVTMDAFHYVGDKFYLLPLLPFTQEKDKFYLLALSQNEVKVYEGSRFTMAELEKNDKFPESLASVLALYEADNSLQYHSAGATIYHGQGKGKEMKKSRYREYLRMVDEGVQAMACDNDQTPLILYATPELVGVYREVNTYDHLLTNYISGNPEYENLESLHAKAWGVLADYYAEKTKDWREYFEEKLLSKEASYQLHEIAPAAFAGQVETLFLTQGQEYWGKYDETTHNIQVHDQRQQDSQPLANDIAVATWQQGGDVRIVDRDEMPRTESMVSAIFRYALKPA